MKELQNTLNNKNDDVETLQAYTNDLKSNVSIIIIIL